MRQRRRVRSRWRGVLGESAYVQSEAISAGRERLRARARVRAEAFSYEVITRAVCAEAIGDDGDRAAVHWAGALVRDAHAVGVAGVKRLGGRAEEGECLYAVEDDEEADEAERHLRACARYGVV